ncbi:hypothetical protein [Chromohalobacter israelensis]|uniref:hypothetical protein n=1 Tax=Chromohalobacter israelensis TaxID=141390 RepID=UPI00265C1C1C|nr:hypothetical protein [Chromohalobacter salexigens]MDO0946000.1 hypothetical protein [Chromohalobacter salexigens]
MSNLDPKEPKVQEFIWRKLDGWYSHLNQIFGTIGVALGFGALSMESPQFYGSLAFAFVMLLWLPEARKMSNLLKLLREEKHPGIGTVSMLQHGGVYAFGLAFLLLIALGVLTPETSFASILDAFGI